jgi:hypothetical protein
MLQEPVTVPTQHLHQFLLLFVVLIPLVNGVERAGSLELSQHQLIILDYLSHVLDPHGTVQGGVTVEPRDTHRLS